MISAELEINSAKPKKHDKYMLRHVEKKKVFEEIDKKNWKRRGKRLIKTEKDRKRQEETGKEEKREKKTENVSQNREKAKKETKKRKI